MEVRSHIKGLAIKLGEVGWSGLPVLGDWQGISWLVVSNCICAITCFVYFIFLFFFFFPIKWYSSQPKVLLNSKVFFFSPPHSLFLPTVGEASKRLCGACLPDRLSHNSHF